MKPFNRFGVAFFSVAPLAAFWVTFGATGDFAVSVGITFAVGLCLSGVLYWLSRKR